jgi:hypothetical protein
MGIAFKVVGINGKDGGEFHTYETNLLFTKKDVRHAIDRFVRQLLNYKHN